MAAFGADDRRISLAARLVPVISRSSYLIWAALPAHWAGQAIESPCPGWCHAGRRVPAPRSGHLSRELHREDDL